MSFRWNYRLEGYDGQLNLQESKHMYRLQMLIHVEDLISMMAGGVMVRQTVFGLKLNFALLLGELLKLPPMPS